MFFSCFIARVWSTQTENNQQAATRGGHSLILRNSHKQHINKIQRKELWIMEVENIFFHCSVSGEARNPFMGILAVTQKEFLKKILLDHIFI